MEEDEQQKRIITEALGLQDPDQPHVVSVESRKKRRRTFLVAILILLAVTLIVVAIVVPLVLVNNDETSDITPQTGDSQATTPTPTPFYSGWSYWTFCSVTCGNGTRTRTRRCNTCDVTEETKPCYRACGEPANWEQWGPWSPCSKTCSVGTQYRTRNCSDAEINCVGDGQKTRGCTLLSVCPATDCLAWLRSGNTSNGVYSIDPDKQGPFNVYCDMTTNGGGWTVFQRRQNGSYLEDFYRNWEDYKAGFGNLTGEFWLGNDNIHRLTASLNTSLLVNIEGWSGDHYNASYSIFYVASENSNYTLNVQQFSGGNARDSLSEHNGMKFTTKDRDNDREGSSNCAQAFHGGWWYNSCYKVNLNGKYVGNKQLDRKGIIWLTVSTNNFNSLKATEMKLRPRQ